MLPTLAPSRAILSSREDLDGSCYQRIKAKHLYHSSSLALIILFKSGSKGILDITLLQSLKPPRTGTARPSKVAHAPPLRSCQNSLPYVVPKSTTSFPLLATENNPLFPTTQTREALSPTSFSYSQDGLTSSSFWLLSTTFPA